MEILSFATEFRPGLGSTQPPNQWVAGAVTPRVKRPWREANHSPPLSADVKNAWSYLCISPIRQHGVIVKHSVNFSFTSTFTSPITYIIVSLTVVPGPQPVRKFYLALYRNVSSPQYHSIISYFLISYVLLHFLASFYRRNSLYSTLLYILHCRLW
jgi:hypothetical protein